MLENHSSRAKFVLGIAAASAVVALILLFVLWPASHGYQVTIVNAGPTTMYAVVLSPAGGGDVTVGDIASHESSTATIHPRAEGDLIVVSKPTPTGAMDGITVDCYLEPYDDGAMSVEIRPDGKNPLTPTYK